jgi:hypothetical protein
MPDPLHELRSGSRTQRGDHGLALGPIAGPHADLQQLVVLQAGVEFGDQPRRQSRSAYQDYRLQVVAEPPKVFYFSFIQRHKTYI